MSAVPPSNLNQPPFRCLIIQLARVGDTVQSLMALRAAKQLYPHLEIHLLVRENFASAAKRVPWIKQLYTLPTEALVGPVLQGKKSEEEGLTDVAHWIKPLVSQPWDMVLNWTFSDASSFLAALIPGRVKLGYTRRRNDSDFTAADGWSQYIQGIIQGGVHQDIHLTDILTTQLLTAFQIHLGDPIGDGSSPITSKSFFSFPISKSNLDASLGDPSKKWIAIQLGASQQVKTWDARKWAKLAFHILSKHKNTGIYLLGGKEDLEKERAFTRELASYLNGKPPVISLVGKTDFDVWTTVIGRSQWLISGDTAAIHIASVLGTRVLNISVGPMRYRETGPYGNGHYVITSGKNCQACEYLKPSASTSEGTENSPTHSCKDDVTPESAYAVWSYALNEWSHQRNSTLEVHFGQLGWSSDIVSIRVYRSRIRNTSDGGGVAYEPVLKRSMKMDDWSSMVMGFIARSWYCGWLPPIGLELQRESLSPSLIQLLRELQESTDLLTKVCRKAIKTSEQIHHKCAGMKSEKVMGIQARQELQLLGKDLQDLEDLIDRLSKAHSPLKAFSQMIKVLMHNLKSTQLAEQSKETAECYKLLADGAFLFQDWIKFTLDLVKPVAIQPRDLTRSNQLSFSSERDLTL